jgi:hypothetical protein
MSEAGSGPSEPYVGPRPFETRDQDLFFGRDREAHEIRSLVLANKFFVLYAASGAGKTSLVNAGVLPLMGDKVEVLPTARFQARDPHRIADAANVYTYAVLSGWAEPDDLDQLTQTTLAGFLASRPRPAEPMDLPMPRLLIFDQFEELFTAHPARWEQRQEFLEQLTNALDADPELRVLVVLREDFMSRLLTFYDALHSGLRDRYFLEPLRRPDAELAISEPLRDTGRSFAPEAVDDLVRRLMTSRVEADDSSIVQVDGEFVEPVLLQVVCQTLWSALPAEVTTITLDDAVGLADVDTSLARFYSDAVREAAALGLVSEAEIREWFQENLLTQPGGTRAAVHPGATMTKGMPNQVVSLLEGKLLRGEVRAGARWLEITHDSLLGPIEQSNRDFFRGTLAGVDRTMTRTADMLAEAVKDQWTRIAFEEELQPEPIPLRWVLRSMRTARPSVAVAATRPFPPLPRLPGAGAGRLGRGGLRELLALYGGPSGRLVVVGPPGSGKTATAVLLVLTALSYREQLSGSDRPSVPVPVLFTINEWNPITQRVEDWLTVRLQETYPAFKAKEVTELVGRGKVALILDGFDQIPADLQPVALRALSKQAVFRVVLFARTEEMAVAARQGVLEGAIEIELQPVDFATAADYLAGVQLPSAQAELRELADRLRGDPDGPLATVLSNPAILTLVRDTFRSTGDARELLGVPDATGYRLTSDSIEDLLLDRVVPAAYAPRPGEAPPRYDLRVATRTLSYIAARMNQEATRDLAWWRIPAWTARSVQAIVTGLVFGLVFGLVTGLAAGLEFGLVFGLGAGLVFGLVFALVAGRRRGRRSPARLAPPGRPWLAIGSWLVGGLVLGLGGMLLFGPGTRLTVQLVGGLVFGLAFGLIFGLSQPAEGTVSALSPHAFWQRSRARGLRAWIAGGLAGWLVGGLAFGLLGGLVAGLGTGGAIALTLFPDIWMAAIAFAELALRQGTPVRLMRFLEDARERNVLRNVGPVYQFRYARLQDRLGRRHVSRDH